MDALFVIALKLFRVTPDEGNKGVKYLSVLFFLYSEEEFNNVLIWRPRDRDNTQEVRESPYNNHKCIYHQSRSRYITLHRIGDTVDEQYGMTVLI